MLWLTETLNGRLGKKVTIGFTDSPNGKTIMSIQKGDKFNPIPKITNVIAGGPINVEFAVLLAAFKKATEKTT